MIPKYPSLMRPVLECAEGGSRKISEVIKEISDQLKLSDDEKRQLLPKRKQTVISNRVHWARFYLKQAGLIRGTKHGWYELTKNGRLVLADESVTLDTKFLKQFDESQKSKSRENSKKAVVELVSDLFSNTPDEALQSAHSKQEEKLADNLLECVRSVTPSFFEKLIVDLLIKMGYGDPSEDAGRTLGQSGDNGVDGVIDQDLLGVDQIYLQAKRYGEGKNVRSSEIRDFRGALDLKKVTKGIFVTTSDFTNAAKQAAKGVNSRIVLINGTKLAKLLIKFNVGCLEKDVLRIKQVDKSYFEEESD